MTRATRLRTSTLAFATALVVAGVASGPALAIAAPEFNPAKPAKNKVTTLSSGNITLKNKTTKETVVCTGGSSKGKVVGAKEIEDIVATFTSCTGEKSGAECGKASNKGAEAKRLGEIETTLLKGTLGLVPAAQGASEVGLMLQPETSSDFVELEFEKNTSNGKGPCIAHVAVEGKVVAEVPASSLGKATGKGELRFEEAAELQKITKFEGFNALLVAFGNSKNALVTTELVTFEEPTEEIVP
jgi:hypothetical protein